MPRRKIDRETGEPALTYRENRMVDQFVTNGGNATRAAVDAGYSPKRASQAAWNVLNRPNVQERIRARVSQAQINPDEVIARSPRKCEPISLIASAPTVPSASISPGKTDSATCSRSLPLFIVNPASMAVCALPAMRPK